MKMIIGVIVGVSVGLFVASFLVPPDPVNAKEEEQIMRIIAKNADPPMIDYLVREAVERKRWRTKSRLQWWAMGAIPAVLVVLWFQWYQRHPNSLPPIIKRWLIKRKYFLGRKWVEADESDQSE